MAESPKKIAVLEKTIQILEYMIEYPYGISLKNLAKGVGLNKSAVYRILSTMKDQGYIGQNPISGEYKIDYKFMSFNSVFENTDIRHISMGHMEALSNQTKLSCHLVIQDRTAGVYISEVESASIGSIRVQAQIGSRIPLHCTSTGKVLLAGLPDSDIDYILSVEGLKAYTKKTVTNPLALHEELRKIRQQGYAVEDCEYEENVKGIAVPIKNSKCITYAAVSITGPDFSMPEESMQKLTDMIRECGKRISRDAGCPDYDVLNFRKSYGKLILKGKSSQDYDAVNH
ncbi:MAG: IclR family transcriptional regulator [Bacillota bacterium]|nr:IclR family transcriptional regulator [Bacillota bacterium]